MFISLVVPYIRPKQTVYIRETLQSAIRDLVESGEEIDLETDPSIVGAFINDFTSDPENGVRSIGTRLTCLRRARGSLAICPRTYRSAKLCKTLTLEPSTLDVWLTFSNSRIECLWDLLDLQLLQWWTDLFVTALTQSTARMPYGMRYIARETLVALKVYPSCYYQCISLLNIRL